MNLNLTDEQKEELRRRIVDFTDWEWCDCPECKVDSHSHAVETHSSLAKLASEVLNDPPLPGQLHVLVERPAGVPSGSQPSPAMLVHLKDQWETALLEILAENGFKCELEAGKSGETFKLKYKGKEASDEQMNRFMREAAVRCGMKVE